MKSTMKRKSILLSLSKLSGSLCYYLRTFTASFHSYCGKQSEYSKLGHENRHTAPQQLDVICISVTSIHIDIKECLFLFQARRCLPSLILHQIHHKVRTERYMITTMLDAPRLQPTQSKSTGDNTIIITEVFSAEVVGSFFLLGLEKHHQWD